MDQRKELLLPLRPDPDPLETLPPIERMDDPTESDETIDWFVRDARRELVENGSRKGGGGT
jgi:hypothetical protein